MALVVKSLHGVQIQLIWMMLDVKNQQQLCKTNMM